MLEVLRVGRHECCADGDICLVRWRGPATLDEVKEIYAHFEPSFASGERIFFLVNLSQTEFPGAEVRRWQAEWSKTHKIAGWAGVGANPVIRSLSRLLTRAIELTTRRKLINRMCKTEDEARAWFASLRAHFAAGKSSGSLPGLSRSTGDRLRPVSINEKT